MTLQEQFWHLVETLGLNPNQTGRSDEILGVDSSGSILEDCPTTLGTLLGYVREAVGNPEAYLALEVIQEREMVMPKVFAVVTGSPFAWRPVGEPHKLWTVFSPANPRTRGRNAGKPSRLGSGKTEFEALVNALQWEKPQNA